MEEFNKEEVDIHIGKYINFNRGSFWLNREASEVIYHQKEIICSYSGASEWCNAFFCSLIDLYSGSSPYNYALGTTDHFKRIPEYWISNPQGVADWVIKSIEKEWFKKCVEAFEFVFDNLPINK